MESEEDDQINNILEIIKEYKESNEFFQEKQLDNDIFKKVNDNKDNNKKKYLKLKYNEIYIINKKPIDDLMNKLNFKEFEDLLNDKNDEEEESIKNKIKDFIKDNPSINIENYLKNLEFYDSEEKIEEIINKNIDIIFVKENFLQALGIQLNKYKNKKIVFSLRKEFIIFYIPKDLSSFMINLNLISDKNPQLNLTNEIKDQSQNENKDKNHNTSSSNQNQINQKSDNKNKIEAPINQIIEEPENEKKEEVEDNKQKNDNQINNINENNSKDEEEIQQKLNKIICLVIYHLEYIYSIDQIQSIYINDLNDIKQIENLLFNNNINNQFINCYLVDSEIFQKFEENVYYEDCENIYYSENMNEKDKKISELYEKIKKDKKSINKFDIINDFQKCTDILNKNSNILFMFVNDKICEEIGLDKKEYEQNNICLFKANDQLFLYFKDKRQIMKVFNMKKYYKLSINIENLIDVPKIIVDELVSLYEQTKNINDLIDNEIKDNSFKTYYLINKNWLNQYKTFYNFDEIVIQYEGQSYDNENEENSQINNNSANNNSNNNNQNQIIGLNENKINKKNKKRRKKKKNNNQNRNNNISVIKQNNNKYDIKVQYMNVAYPEFLLNEKNILPKYGNFHDIPYPEDFELIETATLNKLCEHLKIKISNEILNKICFKALLGDRKLFLQRESIDKAFAVFTSRGEQNILEYLIIYDNKDSVKEEFDIIKKKGIDTYLTDMCLNFNDDKLQYLIDKNNTTTIGKIYIINKKDINYNNINNNFSMNNFNQNNNINNINLNNNIIINNNYDFSISKIDQIAPCRLGLENIGATCYMNATLQCLCNVPQLQNFFLNNEQLYQNQEAILSKGFGEVMQNIYDFKKNKKYYKPNNFKNIISNMNKLFRGIQANDSKDLILFLYEKIHEELKTEINYINYEQNIRPELLLFRTDYYSKNSSIITKTFYYEIQTINECNGCGNQIISYNVQNIIIFPLEKIRQSLMQKYPKGFSYVYLDECFEENEKTEFLIGQNCIYCNICKKLSEAKLINKFNTCPEIMTIILNRGKGIEFEVEFNFPLRIDISNYVNSKNKSAIYDLIGLIIHSGGNDMSGHFFAFCKSNIDHNWYLYNDGIVVMCSQNYDYEIKNKGLPYVLFYQNLDSVYNMNNNTELYFRTANRNEIYFDVNNDELFSNVIQRLSMKFSNCNFNLLNAKYYIETMQGNQLLDYNKTVKQNNLSNYSYIFIEP